MKLKATAVLVALGACFLASCDGCGEEDSALKAPKMGGETDGGDSGTLDGTMSDAPSDSRTDVVSDGPKDAKHDVSSGGSGGSGGAGGSGGGGGNTLDATPDVDFTYDATPVTPWSQLPTKCSDAAERGVQWLVTQQNADGSWGSSSPYREAATGLSVVKLETYAIEHGVSPFSPTFQYRQNVLDGLRYVFTFLSTVPMSGALDGNGNGLGVTGSAGDGAQNYLASIYLMAIVAGRGANQIVDSPSSAVHGWTYQQVAQDMVDNYSACQVGGQGGWRYTCPSGSCDNSVSQYVTLALEYGEHPDYAFMCTIHPNVRTGLWQWVGAIQDSSGGSGYEAAGSWVNPYKTGALLQQFAMLGQGPTAPQVQAAVSYLDTHWTEPLSSTPPDLMAMWAIMKGLVGQGLTMVGSHDWYAEYCDRLVETQNADGSWPASGYGDVLLSTDWALLVLEKAAPANLF